jgi:hypothetical protein
MSQEPRAIIRHGIDFFRDEERSGEVAVEALMEQLDAQQVGRSSGPFWVQGKSGHVIEPTGDGLVHSDTVLDEG